MLGVDQRSDFRRASLVSEIYSETHGPTIGGAGPVPPTTQATTAGSNTGNNGRKASGSAAPGQVKKPIVRPPFQPGMRRKIPKGKFGLIGLGKILPLFFSFFTESSLGGDDGRIFHSLLPPSSLSGREGVLA